MPRPKKQNRRDKPRTPGLVASWIALAVVAVTVFAAEITAALSAPAGVAMMTPGQKSGPASFISVKL